MRILSNLSLLALVTLVVACSDGRVAGDGGVDAGLDAGDDAGVDGDRDAGPDGDRDGGADPDGDGGVDGGDQGLPGPALDLLDDQDFIIPDDAMAGDAVGAVKLYPTRVAAAPVFSVSGGDGQGLFDLDAASGVITVAAGAALTPGQVELRVRVEDGWWDEASMRIRILDRADVVYIDPDNGADAARDGSRAHPLAAWSEVQFAADHAYLQKRGSVYESENTVQYGASRIVMGAYGAGPRPVIRNLASGNVHAVAGYGQSQVTIRDLELSAPAGVSCVYFNGGNSDGLVDNCDLHDATWGVRITSGGNAGHRISHSEIHQIGDDGMFIQDASDVEVAACHIHHVNTHWQPPETPQGEAGGDGVQFSRVAGFSVHHNRIDRTNSGNKFCVIANGSTDGRIEHNDLAGPLSTDEGGASLYFGSDGVVTQNVLVRHNRFSKGGADEVVGAIYSHATGLQVQGNLFIDVPKALFCMTDQTCEVSHNTFYNVPEALSDGRILARNNIFAFGADGQRAFGSIDDLTEDHNLFSAGQAGPGSLVGDPRFVDVPNGDFHLQPGSPAIDAGADLGLPDDLDGTPIPQGQAPDLGAFEFEPE